MKRGEKETSVLSLFVEAIQDRELAERIEQARETEE